MLTARLCIAEDVTLHNADSLQNPATTAHSLHTRWHPLPPLLSRAVSKVVSQLRCKRTHLPAQDVPELFMFLRATEPVYLLRHKSTYLYC
jgi:hypothetical protein